MNRTTARTIGVLMIAGTGLAGAPAAMGSSSSATAAASRVMTWNMNEPPGATVMTDSGSQHLNGRIGSEVRTGAIFNGATGYTFPRLTPNTPPAHPQHLVTIPNAAALNPGSGSYSVEIRYKTTNAFGNLVQKGQSTTAGGQFKIQLPGGRPQCYFKASLGKDGVGWKTPIDDGQWHTLLCVKTSNSVTLYVDGVKRGQKTGPIGNLTNSFPVTIGGKPDCDQVKVSCDYFGGVIDYLKITQG